MFTVYGMSDSGNCYKVRLALEQLALPYRWVEVDSARGETRSVQFPESYAILHYPAEGSRLLPQQRLERVRAQPRYVPMPG